MKNYLSTVIVHLQQKVDMIVTFYKHQYNFHAYNDYYKVNEAAEIYFPPIGMSLLASFGFLSYTSDLHFKKVLHF